MVARRLSKEEVVTIGVLAGRGQNHCEIARTLGVTEGAVRYHLRRRVQGAPDGRKDPEKVPPRFQPIQLPSAQ